MEKKKYSFIEGGFFTAGLFVVGAVIGLLISTDAFQRLNTYEGIEVVIPIVCTLLGGYIGVLAAKVVRDKV